MRDLAVNRSRCVCRAMPGEPHDLACIVPAAVVDDHPELWQLLEDAPTHRTDDTLESCTRAAIKAWVASGRTLS